MIDVVCVVVVCNVCGCCFVVTVCVRVVVFACGVVSVVAVGVMCCCVWRGVSVWRFLLFAVCVLDEVVCWLVVVAL